MDSSYSLQADNTHQQLLRMITRDICTHTDVIDDTFWSEGIANPIEVIEQITGEAGRAFAVLQHRTFRWER